MAAGGASTSNDRWVTLAFAIVSAALVATGWARHRAWILVLAALVAGIALVGLTGGFRKWLPWWVFALFVLLAGMTVLGQLDALLSGMHVFGGTRSGISALGASKGQPEAAHAVIRAWYRWYFQLPSVRAHYDSPAKVVQTYLAVDSFLVVPALGAVLGMLLVNAGRGFGKVQRWLPRTGLVLLLVGLAADELENASYRAAFTAFAAKHPHATDLATALLPWTHRFTIAKLIGYGVAALALLLTAIARGTMAATRQPFTDTRHVLSAVRAEVGVVIVVAVILVAPQVSDLILRWNVRQGIIATFFALCLALVTWAFARRITLPRNASSSPPRLTFTWWAMVIIGGLAGIVGVAFFVWPMHTGAWGLFVPAGFWLLMGVLTYIFDRFPPPRPRTLTAPDPDRGGVVARVTACAVLVLLALAIIRATVGVAVVNRGPVPEARLLVIGFFILAGAWLLYLGLRWHKLDLRTVQRSVGNQVQRTLPPTYRGLASGIFPFAIVLVMAIGGYLWFRIADNPWAVGQFLGTIGIILLFLTVASVVVGILAALAEWIDAPRPMKAMGFRRFPVFILLAGWFVIASTLPFDKGFHDVRFLAGDPSTDGGRIVTVRDAFGDWLSAIQVEEFQKRTGDDGTKHAIPLIIISASGGAIRAGFWTDLVLDCIFSAEPMHLEGHPDSPCKGSPAGTKGNPFFFAASSVSGSSVGTVEYVAHSVLQSQGNPDAGWVTAHVGGDYLSGELAWNLAVELPRVFFRFNGKMDRGEALERAWQQSWVSGPWTPGWGHAFLNGSHQEDDGPLTAGFLDTWQARAGPNAGGPDGAYVPLMILNGSNVVDGCRLATSPLDSDGHPGPLVPNTAGQVPGCLNTPGEVGSRTDRVLAATLDLDGFLCEATATLAGRRDVELSTAALLSARFPFVSPSGRIEQCGGAGTAVFAVDGGYLDASGGFTAVELWRSLAPAVGAYNLSPTTTDPRSGFCVVPFLIQIDNGYSEPKSQSATKRQEELTVPLKGALASRSVVSELARQQAALAFGGPDPADGIIFNGSRYAHFYPRVHPGAQAPLNWVLSNTSQGDLFDQLSNNIQAINRVSGWLTGTNMRCP
jgi:hypothetical protein